VTVSWRVNCLGNCNHPLGQLSLASLRSLNRVPASAEVRRESHRCRVAGKHCNPIWHVISCSGVVEFHELLCSCFTLLLRCWTGSQWRSLNKGVTATWRTRRHSDGGIKNGLQTLKVAGWKTRSRGLEDPPTRRYSSPTDCARDWWQEYLVQRPLDRPYALDAQSLARHWHRGLECDDDGGQVRTRCTASWMRSAATCWRSSTVTRHRYSLIHYIPCVSKTTLV